MLDVFWEDGVLLSSEGAKNEILISFFRPSAGRKPEGLTIRRTGNAYHTPLDEAAIGERYFKKALYSTSLAALAAHRRFEKFSEQRVRRKGARLKFWVELRAEHKGVLGARKLRDFHK